MTSHKPQQSSEPQHLSPDAHDEPAPLPSNDNVADQPASTDSVTLPTVDEARAPMAPPESAQKAARRRSEVHVADNLLDLVTVSVGPDEAVARKQQHDLNHVVHQVLIVGLVISTALMVLGVALDIFLQRELPQTVPSLRDVFQRVLAVRPSGFLALGLLMLIATPILRVVGSIAAFVYEHEWRYAMITTFVLTVMVVSILLGHG